MCLHVVDKQISVADPEVERDAWKVFVSVGRLQFPFFSNKADVIFDTWLMATQGHVEDVILNPTDPDGVPVWTAIYPAGFHCFTSEEDALGYSNMCFCLNGIVRKVRVRGIVATGKEYIGGTKFTIARVIVARELYIPSEGASSKCAI